MEIAHHAARSSYGRIGRLLAAADPRVEALGARRLPRRLPRAVAERLIADARPEWYREETLAVELALARRVLARRTDLIHLFHGDEQLWWTTRVVRVAGPRRPRVLATLHQPPEVLARVGPGRRRLRELDAVIAFCAPQAEALGELVGGDRVFTVPHATDTGWWTPGKGVRADATVLVVGQWLRDTDVVRGVVARLADRAPAVRVRLVGAAPELADALRGAANVTVLGRLEDEALREEYRSASLLLLALRYSTCNCALLESLACGTPAVVTDVGGVRSYVDASCAVLTPPADPETTTEQVLELLGDAGRRATLSRAARERSARFDQGVVVARTAEVYAQVAR